MRVPPPPRAVVPVLAASAGVVGAHALGYLAVFPHAGERAAHLDATGHAYWPLAAGGAMAAASIALLVAIARGTTGGTTICERGRSLVGLLACQTGAFAVLEAAERALAGLSPSVLLASPEFWLGLLLQVPVAMVAMRLLTVVERTAARLVTALRRRPATERSAAVWRPPHGRTPAAVSVPYRLRPRGPPFTLTT